MIPPTRATTCRYCGARSDGELVETLAAMADCNNCRIDIQALGEWTGVGYLILQALIKRYGRDEALKADREVANALRAAGKEP